MPDKLSVCCHPNECFLKKIQLLENTSKKNMLPLGAILANKAAPYSMSDQKSLVVQGFESKFPKAGGWASVTRGWLVLGCGFSISVLGGVCVRSKHKCLWAES